MDVDLVITLGIAVLALLITWLGMSKPKRWHKVVFLFSSALMLILIFVQAYRNSNTQRDLKAQLDAIQRNTDRPVQVLGFLQLDKIVVPSISAPLFSLGAPSAINLAYKNKGSQPVTGAKQYSSVAIARNGMDTQVLEQFKRDFQAWRSETDNEEGVITGPGQFIWVTLITPPFTEQLINELMQGTVSLYILGTPYWNEKPEGAHVCLRLQPPDSIPLKDGHMVWHPCVIRKS